MAEFDRSTRFQRRPGPLSTGKAHSVPMQWPPPTQVLLQSGGILAPSPIPIFDEFLRAPTIIGQKMKFSYHTSNRREFASFERIPREQLNSSSSVGAAVEKRRKLDLTVPRKTLGVRPTSPDSATFPRLPVLGQKVCLREQKNTLQGGSADLIPCLAENNLLSGKVWGRIFCCLRRRSIAAGFFLNSGFLRNISESPEPILSEN